MEVYTTPTRRIKKRAHGGVPKEAYGANFTPYLFDLTSESFSTTELSTSEVESFLDSHFQFLSHIYDPNATSHITEVKTEKEPERKEHESFEVNSRQVSMVLMESFPHDKVKDWKHVIYNLLVENHNSETKETLVQPVEISVDGRLRRGFTFNENMDPAKRLPELYALHIRKAQLEKEDQNSVFVQDLYKFYLRACYQLLSQYFERNGQWTYLYCEEAGPLFIPNENLEQAEARLRQLGTRRRSSKCQKLMD